MASVNKVILIGNLGQAPDVRMTHSNMKVAEISIATTRRFTRNDERGRPEIHRSKRGR